MSAFSTSSSKVNRELRLLAEETLKLIVSGFHSRFVITKLLGLADDKAYWPTLTSSLAEDTSAHEKVMKYRDGQGMKNHDSQLPDRLYKYVIAERMDILLDGKIRFTNPSDLNDPLDMRPHVKQINSERYLHNQASWFTSKLGRERLAERFSQDDLRNEISAMSPQERTRLTRRDRRERFRELKKLRLRSPDFRELHLDVTKAAVLTFDRVNKELAEELPESFNQTVGVLSLTEEADNEMMWALYADQNTGFVLVLQLQLSRSKLSYASFQRHTLYQSLVS